MDEGKLQEMLLNNTFAGVTGDAMLEIQENFVGEASNNVIKTSSDVEQWTSVENLL